MPRTFPFKRGYKVVFQKFTGVGPADLTSLYRCVGTEGGISYHPLAWESPSHMCGPLTVLRSLEAARFLFYNTSRRPCILFRCDYEPIPESDGRIVWGQHETTFLDDMEERNKTILTAGETVLAKRVRLTKEISRR
jgi:hypothetical protein